MKTLLARSFALIAFTAVPAVAHAQSATYSWAGFYAGLHSGYGWGDNDVDTSCKDPAGVLDGTPNCGLTLGEGIASNYSLDQNGFLGGAQAGYNFQSGSFVFGIETDIAWSNIDGSDTTNDPLTNFPPLRGRGRVSQDLEWLGTVRGRLGYAISNWLLFGTGGLAYGKVDRDFSFSIDIAPPITWNDSDSSTETGWTVGGGAEVAFGQWSVKGEYLYYDLGDGDTSAQEAQFGLKFDNFLESDFETKGHIARIGLNYHFN